jgi:putative ABC transport system permease protein
MVTPMAGRLRNFVLRLRSWFSPGAGAAESEHEFERELASHLEMLTEENVRRGMSSDEAARAARIRLGGTTQLSETNRELRGSPWLETFLQDARYALRMLRKNPGFTAVAILTLALGIGANTAIFSVVYAVLLKPLPYTHPEQLVTAFQANLQEGVPETGVSYPNFEEWRAQNHVFSEMASIQGHQLTLTGRGEPSVVDTSVITPEYFALLEVKPLAGRIFFSDDGKKGAEPVVVISENLWRGALAADPKIVGSSIVLDKRPFTVVGIMPADFRISLFNSKQDLWIPIAQDPLFSGWMARRGGHYLPVVGRLKPGVSLQQAQAEMDGISQRLAQEFPAENNGWTVNLVPLQKELVGDVRSALLILLAAVGLVLLIACANIANLLLTRATSRSKEIAVRTALGASRSRIIRQLLCETTVLGLLGGVAGVALAYWGVQALSSFIPDDLPRLNAIRVDPVVLVFALVLSAIAGIAFGLVPALFAVKSDVQNSLREGGGRSGESGNRRRARNVLAVAEISLAMVLLVAAGLMLRSFSKLMAVGPGFDPAHIVNADISLPQFQYSTPQQWTIFSDEFLARIQAQPGLQDSAIVVPRPLTDGFVNLGFTIEGVPPTSANDSRTADYASVSAEYFRVMGIPLMAGRLFSPQDNRAAPKVALISRAMAQRYFPNQDPIGKRINFAFPPDPDTPREIVGVVGDVRDVSLDKAPGPMMYAPYAQSPFWGANLVVKSGLSTAAVAAAIRAEVQKMDKDLPVTNIAKMPDLIDASVAQQKFRTFLLGLFAAIALVLAATGIFGVISYSVACRTNEIGIRAALGASRGAILGMVLRETLLLTFAGLAVGIPCALAAAHLLGHMLFGVSPGDPTTIAIVTLTLAAVATLAGYIPARRAMNVHPMVALRHE